MWEDEPFVICEFSMFSFIVGSYQLLLDICQATVRFLLYRFACFNSVFNFLFFFASK